MAVLDLSFVLDGKGYLERTRLKFTAACFPIPTASVSFTSMGSATIGHGDRNYFVHRKMHFESPQCPGVAHSELWWG